MPGESNLVRRHNPGLGFAPRFPSHFGATYAADCNPFRVRGHLQTTNIGDVPFIETHHGQVGTASGQGW